MPSERYKLNFDFLWKFNWKQLIESALYHTPFVSDEPQFC